MNRTFFGFVALSFLLGSILLPSAQAAPAESAPPPEGASSTEPKTYRLADGCIEIKPRLKYEIILSLHVLRCAEDHHPQFIGWANQMRAWLKPETLREATNLNALFHEWQLCSLVQNYDGPDTIDGLTAYIQADARREVASWAGRFPAATLKQAGADRQQFASWYADLLERYYQEGFGKTWEAEHRRLVQEQAPETAKSLEQLPYSITGFMEQHTGRKFQGGSKVIFYPSSFSRPQHAYGFEENGAKVVLYKVSESPGGAMATAFHELLHPLLRSWHYADRMKPVIAALGRQPPFERTAQALRSSYDYPAGCLEEMIVHALGNYLCVKAGTMTEAEARRHGYGPFQTALYDAMFDRYEKYRLVDDFIYFALTHIQPAEERGSPKWVYKE